jgi:hypothetical protein
VAGLTDLSALYPGERGQEPMEMTNNFIRDYEIWNDLGYADLQRTDSFAWAEAAYDVLIAKYCAPDKQHLNLALGSESSHSPQQERTVSEVRGVAKSVVKTEHVNAWGHVKHHEYHFSQTNNHWVLEELYYLDEYDDDRPLPCL